jgi:hypothetical protein
VSLSAGYGTDVFSWTGKLAPPYRHSIISFTDLFLSSRMVSTTHGRPPMILHQHASAVPLPLSSDPLKRPSREGQDGEQIRVSFFVQTVQLYAIIHLSIIAFHLTNDPQSSTEPNNSQGAREKDLETLLRLDSALETWEQGLPRHLCFATVHELENDICKRQAIILRLR